MSEEAKHTPTLKPCPFCEGEALMRRVPRIQVWRVSCKNCDASPNGSLTEEQAVAKWNKRAELSTLRTKLERAEKALELAYPVLAHGPASEASMPAYRAVAAALSSIRGEDQ